MFVLLILYGIFVCRIFCNYSSFVYQDELLRETGNWWFTANNVCIEKPPEKYISNILIFIPNMQVYYEYR